MRKEGGRPLARIGIVPAYLWFVILLALPLLYIVVVSFCKTNGSWGILFEFTTENYSRMAEPMYLAIFARSFKTAVEATLLTLAIGYPYAYLMTRFGRAGRTVALLGVILPFVVSAVVRIHGWTLLLQNEGLVNQALQGLGLAKGTVSLLFTEGAVLVGIVNMLLPLMILPLYNSIERIDPSLVEAARDLGSNARQAFFCVTVRNSLPGILSGCLLVFVPSVGLFYISDMLGGANGMLLGNLIQNQFMQSHDWPFGAALAVVMTVAALALVALVRRFSHTDRIEVLG